MNYYSPTKPGQSPIGLGFKLLPHPQRWGNESTTQQGL